MTSETEPYTDGIDDKAERNRPDLGGPSWHESMQQIQSGFVKQLDATLKSAIERKVIPHISSHFELTLWRDSLKLVLSERLQSQGADGDVQQKLTEPFSDEELQRAWQYLTRIMSQLENEQSRTTSPYEFIRQHLHRKHQEEYDQHEIESAMWNDYVAREKLPSSQQLSANPILHGLWVEQAERYIQQQEELEQPIYLDGAAIAWEDAKRQYSQHLIEQSKKAMGIGTETNIDEAATLSRKERLAKFRSEDSFIRYSLVYWAVNRRTPRVPQKEACRIAQVKERTYQNKKKMPEVFWSDTDIQREIGATFEELWECAAEGGDISNFFETDY